VMFLIKTAENKKKNAGIHYITLTDEMRKREKLEWFSENKISNLPFQRISPDKDNNWLNITDNDFDKFIPLIDKDVKTGKSEQAIFHLFSRGIATQRDEWVYDFSKEALTEKINYFVEVYQNTLKNENFKDRNSIKWDADLTSYLHRKIDKNFSEKQVILGIYRPFTKKYFYFDKHFNGRTYQWFNIYRSEYKNKYIAYNALGNTKSFHLLGTADIIDLHLTGDSQCLPLYSYDKSGNRTDNITDWALQQFTGHYQDDSITKEDLFHYTYAVLHNPEYRKKYEINLKREFPRLPFYEDFYKWAKWGKSLMDLHIAYESAKPYSLKIHETAHKDMPKAKLQAVPEKGEIVLDENTVISGIPASAWEYKLGNRSALHWILDQYKEKKPKDKTIAEKFDTYRFADYKEQVIDLLKRVSAVSVKTVEIVKEMEKSGER